MTKTTRNLAIIAAFVLFAGGVFKTQNLPGATILLILGGTTGILFFGLLFGLFRKTPASRTGQFTRIFASATVMMMLLALMFSVLHWPGAKKLIWLADIGALFACIFFFADGYTEKDPEKSILKFFIAYFLLLLVILIMMFGYSNGFS